ncbi:molybdopterin converting factor subunit 1 [Deinococcus peraridilitoris]|uniref:Molybdopterin converting factor, subunit 1 n=1 Tax=Deinococcus peraridilitoris (strain DSM 19664 / LMG 22246 / CIP 109416 / KR-200) TaxID=937777 RepID=K9ZYH0_DEIPD|nr:molybdopterin converting factor subunit 1 [Deinococcus peraridilitoris]AFZ66249.1 molybdopterin converting factor, subunit 1 [Deinococcus peraridilitoris DSM 19664]
MNVTVLFFARLKREAGTEQVHVELPPGSSARDLAAGVSEQHGVSLQGCMIAVNEQYATPDTLLRDGDEVAFLPPVAGGSGEGQGEADTCLLTDAPLSLGEAQDFVTRPQWGAQAFFVGTVRSPNQGVDIAFIDYEAYPPMARRVLQDAANAARAKFALGGVYLAHRTGRLLPGEASIIIAVGSAHRRAALEGCDFLIEHLKVHIPVWKLEVGVNGERWVEGTAGAPTL